MIAQGRVTVNGVTALLGQSADDEQDLILLDGVPLPKQPECVYIMLNKPRGYVTTLSDEKNRKTVAQLVQDCGVRVYPVGRLDYNSEGLLIMTNDGNLTNKMTHPSNEKTKTYVVSVKGDISGAQARLSMPMLVDGYRIQPAQVKMLAKRDNRADFEITIHEGRNRQIRKMCQQCGLSVTRLVRIKEDGLELGNLETGKWRYLTENEKMHILN
jgi:23S rRNA pseudouridine2605 synthase